MTPRTSCVAGWGGARVTSGPLRSHLDGIAGTQKPGPLLRIRPPDGTPSEPRITLQRGPDCGRRRRARLLTGTPGCSGLRTRRRGWRRSFTTTSRAPDDGRLRVGDSTMDEEIAAVRALAVAVNQRAGMTDLSFLDYLAGQAPASSSAPRRGSGTSPSTSAATVGSSSTRSTSPSRSPRASSSTPAATSCAGGGEPWRTSPSPH